MPVKKNTPCEMLAGSVAMDVPDIFIMKCGSDNIANYNTASVKTSRRFCQTFLMFVSVNSRLVVMNNHSLSGGYGIWI